jgi:hypothetical protein
MIDTSKLGAIAFVAAIGVASPAFAQGGSAGYNATATGPNWRLGPHHTQDTSAVRHPIKGKLYMHHPITSKTVAQPNENK